MLTFLKDLFRPSDRRQPQYDLNDPRHPVNAGWRRSDLPEATGAFASRSLCQSFRGWRRRPRNSRTATFMGGFRQWPRLTM